MLRCQPAFFGPVDRNIIPRRVIPSRFFPNRVNLSGEFVQEPDALDPAGIQLVVIAPVDHAGHIILFRDNRRLNPFIDVGHDLTAGLQPGNPLNTQGRRFECLSCITGLPFSEVTLFLGEDKILRETGFLDGSQTSLRGFMLGSLLGSGIRCHRIGQGRSFPFRKRSFRIHRCRQQKKHHQNTDYSFHVLPSSYKRFRLVSYRCCYYTGFYPHFQV